MDCRQLDYLLKSIPSIKPFYGGCVKLRKFIRKNSRVLKFVNNQGPNLYILLSFSSKTASLGHFQLLCVDPTSRKSLIFDSAGLKSLNSKLSHFLPKILSLNQVTINTDRIQPKSSCTCGLYCVFVAYYLSEGKSYASIVSQFSQKLKKNDKQIWSWFRRKFSSWSSAPSKNQLLHCSSLS